MLAESATACGESEGASNGERGVNEETDPLYEDLPDSQSLAEQIKAINSNVGGIEAFDESTDPNGISVARENISAKQILKIPD